MCLFQPPPFHVSCCKYVNPLTRYFSAAVAAVCCRYSPSGDVMAPLVYVNYGRPEDFDALEAAGVSVAGTIVIARYGGSGEVK